MSDLFLKIVNMSISASWLVLVVLLLRFVLKKAPKWANVLLWAIVAVRLICPFSIESALSLIPSAETISPNIMMEKTPTIQTGVPAINSVINPVIGQSFAPDPGASANPLQILIPIITIVWAVGIAVLLIYTAVSYWRLRHKVSEAVVLQDNIFQSENVVSPFVLGIIKPRIYLPYHMEEQDVTHVVAHEQAHIKRRDHWWNPLGFLLLTIHWFNPLMWLAYVLLCRDIELACDEKVIKDLGNEQRADYTQALVSCSVNRRMIAACPLAFGEVGVKDRVKSVMNYKKPAFWVVLLAVIACIVVAVCFLTNPADDDMNAPEPFGHSYRVAEILHDAPQFSFTYTVETAPRYQFPNDYGMLVSGDVMDTLESDSWMRVQGACEEVKITTENFDNYFDMNGWLVNNAVWSEFRSTIKKAWRIDVQDDENGAFYYFMQTSSGDVYLSYGYDKEHPPLIRWLFRLERTDLITCNAVSEGIDAFIAPAYYPQNDINRDTTVWPSGEVNEAGTLIFSVEHEIDALVISEEYYNRKDKENVVIENDSHELSRNEDGTFELPVTCRGSQDDTIKYYIQLENHPGVYVMEIEFGSPTTSSNAGAEASELNKDIPGKTYLYENEGIMGAFTITLYEDGTFSYYEGMASSYLGTGSFMMDGDILVMTDDGHGGYGLVNRFRRDGDDLVFIEQESDNFVYVKVKDGERFHCTGEAFKQNNESSGISHITDPTDDSNFSYDTAVEKIFEDANNEYFISGLYSQHIIVHYTDGTQEDIVSALNSGRATIADLDKFGIRYWTEPKADAIDIAINKAIIEHYASDEPDGLINVESHILLANEAASGTPLFGQDNHMEETTVYLLVFHEKYSTYGGNLEAVGGSYVPTAITFSISESGEYTLKEYWEPRDGSYYVKDIKEKFPGASADDALNDQAYIEELQAQNLSKAQAYLNSTGSIDLRIAELLNIIQSSPAYSSNPGDYIEAHRAEYDELLSDGGSTLKFCFTEFLAGGQIDLRGHIMASACKDIMSGMGEVLLYADSVVMTGQDWFDAFYANAKELERQYSKEDLEKYYPASWLLLQMINE